MEVSYDGIGQVAATFIKGAGVEAGMAVAVEEENTVGCGASGDKIDGVVLAAEKEHCTVQVAGFVRVSYTGDALSPGRCALCLAGDGTVKRAASGGTDCLVVQVDEDSETAVIML